jgi:hypothetical protein
VHPVKRGILELWPLAKYSYPQIQLSAPKADTQRTEGGANHDPREKQFMTDTTNKMKNDPESDLPAMPDPSKRNPESGTHLPTMPDPLNDPERGQRLPTDPDPTEPPTRINDPLPRNNENGDFERIA